MRRTLDTHALTRPWATSGRPPGLAGKPKRLPFPLARVSRTDAQRAYVCSGCHRWSRRVGPTGASGRAVAWTGSATEEASQSGIVIRTESEPIQRHSFGATPERSVSASAAIHNGHCVAAGCTSARRRPESRGRMRAILDPRAWSATCWREQRVRGRQQPRTARPAGGFARPGRHLRPGPRWRRLGPRRLRCRLRCPHRHLLLR